MPPLRNHETMMKEKFSFAFFRFYDIKINYGGRVRALDVCWCTRSNQIMPHN